MKIVGQSVFNSHALIGNHLNVKNKKIYLKLFQDILGLYIQILTIFKIMGSMKYVQVENSHLQKELMSIVEEVSHLLV